MLSCDWLQCFGSNEQQIGELMLICFGSNEQQIGELMLICFGSNEQQIGEFMLACFGSNEQKMGSQNLGQEKQGGVCYPAMCIPLCGISLSEVILTKN